MRSQHPPEFRQQVTEFVHEGRNGKELAREFEPSEQAIGEWGRQADVAAGRRSDGLTTEEREEVGRLRRENRLLRLDRMILQNAAAWFARETGSVPKSARIREGGSGQLSGAHDVPQHTRHLSPHRSCLTRACDADRRPRRRMIGPTGSLHTCRTP